MCINGRFVYAIKHKPLKAGHANTEAYVDNQRGLDGRLRAKGPQEEIGRNDSPQKQSCEVYDPLSAISRSKWNFAAVGFARAFLKTKPLQREIYGEPPIFAGKNPEAMR